MIRLPEGGFRERFLDTVQAQHHPFDDAGIGGQAEPLEQHAAGVVAARVHRVDRDHDQLALLRLALDPASGRRHLDPQPPVERAHVRPVATDRPATDDLATAAFLHPHHDALANALGARPLARRLDPDEDGVAVEGAPGGARRDPHRWSGALGSRQLEVAAGDAAELAADQVRSLGHEVALAAAQHHPSVLLELFESGTQQPSRLRAVDPLVVGHLIDELLGGQTAPAALADRGQQIGGFHVTIRGFLCHRGY